MNVGSTVLTTITFQVADAEMLPFAEVSFDAVIARIRVLEFVEVERALVEMEAGLGEYFAGSG